MASHEVIGAGILGNMHYNDASDRWAIVLGQWLQTLAQQLESTQASNDQSVDWYTCKFIYTILGNNNINFDIYGAAVANFDQRSDIVADVLNEVHQTKGSTSAVLLLIGQWTYTTNWMQDDQQHVRDFQQRIESLAPELEIAAEPLGNALMTVACDAKSISRELTRLSRPLKVLIMSASPLDQGRLRISDERRELEEAIRLTRFKDKLIISKVPNCRVRDISRNLDYHHPNILHFSGHGSQTDILFLDDQDNAVPVHKTALASLLSQQQSLKLVILNSCYSMGHAQAIAEAVGCAIVVGGAIDDESSINFSREFYRALGCGQTIEEAFKWARAAVEFFSPLDVWLLNRQAWN
ncbi:hypothetical protein K402DRAFT_458697 [Aulographum hederae CBS 113979]|uniref:CHAT domain-containing protein n=1 Tax=Aulographum hederae CBS 113979 TaxID=1176131 RepID=A0A6G1HGG0_9PEZI|nr:hypothetical protein K402DRAFT_458697 [Aulographum hederae CBS 113979]